MLEEALYLLDRNYVDIIDKDALAEEFIPLILKTLDPHSVYLTAFKSRGLCKVSWKNCGVL